VTWASQLTGLLSRLASYRAVWWEVAIEVILIGTFVYIVIRFVQGTRAAGALKAIILLFLAVTVLARVLGGTGGAFQRLAFLYDRVLAIVALGLIVVFQPELRRAAFRLGEATLFRATPSEINSVVDAIVQACAYLGKARFGGLIVVERQVGLKGLAEGGVQLAAELTPELLQTIFFPGTALHDLAVIVRGKKIEAAGVQLPLAEPADMPDPTFGSRHRAAVGLSKECDALVVVVSEETGLIRLAERGRLSPGMSAELLKEELLRRLTREPPQVVKPAETHEDEARSAQEPGAAA
jgi:diadenylate cyclase